MTLSVLPPPVYAEMRRNAFSIALIAAFYATPQPVLAGGLSADLPAAARPGLPDYVAEAARRFAIPDKWIYTVIRFESRGDVRAVSPKGACGLMQIMPPTWARLRARYGLGPDIFDARDNILAGAAYLRELYDRYGSPGLFAAYNAGPKRYEDYLYRGRSLPSETVVYVRNLTTPEPLGAAPGGASAPHSPRADWTASGLFISRSSAAMVPASSSPSDTPPAGGIAPPPARITVPVGLFPSLSGRPAR
jgi:hypothetical protein